jgi:glycosidase
MLLLTLPGTLTIYYGEELGMTNVMDSLRRYTRSRRKKPTQNWDGARSRTYSYAMGLF